MAKMPKLTTDIEAQLNVHAASRAEHEALFQTYRSYFMAAGYTKISKYFGSIAKGEAGAREKVFHFILERGGCMELASVPTVGKVTKRSDVVATTKELMARYLGAIVQDGTQLGILYLAALENDDIATCVWLNELVTEQAQMETDAEELVNEFGFCQTKMDVWLIDQHLTY